MKRVKLKDLPIKWKRGSGLRKSDVVKDGTNECVLYGELFTKHKDVKIDSDALSKTNNSGTSLSKKGDVLVPGTSTASKNEMIRAREIDKDGVVIGGDINIIRPEPGIFAEKYLAYCFETQDAKRQLKKYITGSTGIIHISNSGLQNLEIPLPSIEEQKKIVSKLDAEFDRISRVEKLLKENLENVDKLQKSILSEAFKYNTDTHTHRFCEIIDSVRIPSKIQKKEYLSAGSFPIISQEEGYINGYWNNKKDRIVVTKPVIVWGDHTRIIKFVNQDFVAGADGTKVFLPHDDIDTKWLYYWMQANPVKSLGYARHFRLLKEMAVDVPGMDIQLQSAKKVDGATKKIETLKNKLNKEMRSIQNLRNQILTESFSS